MDQIEKLGDLEEILLFVANKTFKKHWKRTRKKSYLAIFYQKGHLNILI